MYLGRKRVRHFQLWRLVSRSFSTRFGSFSDERSSLGANSKRGCFSLGRRFENTHVEATLNHPFPAPNPTTQTATARPPLASPPRCDPCAPQGAASSPRREITTKRDTGRRIVAARVRGGERAAPHDPLATTRRVLIHVLRSTDANAPQSIDRLTSSGPSPWSTRRGKGSPGGGSSSRGAGSRSSAFLRRLVSIMVQGLVLLYAGEGLGHVSAVAQAAAQHRV